MWSRTISMKMVLIFFSINLTQQKIIFFLLQKRYWSTNDNMLSRCRVLLHHHHHHHRRAIFLDFHSVVVKWRVENCGVEGCVSYTATYLRYRCWKDWLSHFWKRFAFTELCLVSVVSMHRSRVVQVFLPAVMLHDVAVNLPSWWQTASDFELLARKEKKYVCSSFKIAFKYYTLK